MSKILIDGKEKNIRLIYHDPSCRDIKTYNGVDVTSNFLMYNYKRNQDGIFIIDDISKILNLNNIDYTVKIM